MIMHKVPTKRLESLLECYEEHRAAHYTGVEIQSVLSEVLASRKKLAEMHCELVVREATDMWVKAMPGIMASDKFREPDCGALVGRKQNPVAWIIDDGGAPKRVTLNPVLANTDPLVEVTPLYAAPIVSQGAPLSITSPSIILEVSDSNGTSKEFTVQSAPALNFDTWWNDDAQAELKASCAKGWGYRIWNASRASITMGDK